jgi:transposase
MNFKTAKGELTMAQTTLQREDSGCERLFAALELSNKKWKLAMSAGGKRHQEVTVPAGNLAALFDAFEKAKTHFHLGSRTLVVSCYEAGRDGFWLHRELEQAGVENLVVDSSSIEVDRRQRRAKTDRLDAWRLLRQLERYAGGDRHALRVVRVPSVEAEDARRLHREVERLRGERTAHANRIRGLLVLHGLRVALRRNFVERLGEARVTGGGPVPPQLCAELVREFGRWQLVNEHVKQLEAALNAQLAADGEADPAVHTIQKLYRLRAIGITSATVFTREFFGWRDFRNRRQVGAASGLVSMPYASGDRSSDQGISKAGNERIRATLIQIGWAWLRYQPDSALTKWFIQRFASSPRLRRIGIVALARRLLIDLWRYVERDIVPAGAQFKPTPTAA